MAKSGAHVGASGEAWRAEASREAWRAQMGVVAKSGAHVRASGEAWRAEANDDVVSLRKDTKTALEQMGWKPAIANAAANAAVAALGGETTLERMIAEALRRCPARHYMAPPLRGRGESG